MRFDIARTIHGLCLTLALGGLATAAAAQPFEEVYGTNATAERGEKGVLMSTICPTPGYVAVGTKPDGPLGVNRVYLVKSDLAGARLWERTYDIGNDGLPDEGYAVIEIAGGGMMITGTSHRPTYDGVFLLQVDCGGLTPNSAIYGPGLLLGNGKWVGRDLIQATTGNPLAGTNVGDIVVAGHHEVGGAFDAFMLRAQAGLGVVWYHRYDFTEDSKFFGLTEAVGGVGTADLVAVGEVIDPLTGETDGLASRVSGDTGLNGGFPRCAALHGSDESNEGLHSVVALQNDAPNLAMAGYSDNQAMGLDVYIIKTGADPCTVLFENFVGNEANMADDEVAFDIQEILQPVDPATGAQVGDLALTGYSSKPNSHDAFLLFVCNADLLSLNASLFGDHAGAIDEGRSLAQNALNGFTLAGFSASDFQAVGDPLDLYLVNTDNAGATGCELGWFPQGVAPIWQRRTRVPNAIGNIFRTIVNTTWLTPNSLYISCPTP